MTVSPEMLAAFADYELPADEARAIEHTIATDAALRAQVAAHRALRVRLAGHFAPVLDEQVPNRLGAMLQKSEQQSSASAQVIDFASASRKRHSNWRNTRWARFGGPALAASLVVAVIGFGLRGVSGNVEAYAASDLAGSLDRQLVASKPADAKARILLSFRDRQAAYCRVYATARQSGIACRDDHGWRLAQVFGTGTGDAATYRQAGSADADAMRAAQAMAEGGALDAKEEATARDRKWSAH